MAVLDWQRATGTYKWTRNLPADLAIYGTRLSSRLISWFPDSTT